jgi:hypothetical protein
MDRAIARFVGGEIDMNDNVKRLIRNIRKSTHLAKYDLMFTISGIYKEKRYLKLKQYCEEQELNMSKPYHRSDIEWDVLVVCNIDQAIKINDFSGTRLVERQGKLQVNYE